MPLDPHSKSCLLSLFSLQVKRHSLPALVCWLMPEPWESSAADSACVQLLALIAAPSLLVSHAITMQLLT